MLTQKQFIDAFTAAGGWFFLKNFETVINWKGTKKQLVNELYSLGFDSKITGTSTRVSSMIRIIDNNMGKEALLKIQESKIINKQHPEAFNLAEDLIAMYY